MGNWLGSLFKDEALGLTWDLAPEETRSYLGTFGPTRDSCSVYPCETQSQWGRRAVWGGRFRGGQTSGPLRPAQSSSTPSAFFLKHIYKVRYKTRRSGDTQSTASPSGAGGKKGMLLPPQHPIPTPESLKSFTATRDVLGIQLGQRKNQTPS